jgi:hypothetical protein
MSEKLSLAIKTIKEGNKQLGQQLLSQVLQSDPNNEQAWLWMSAVVDEDKRRYCIERALKINPNNQQAIMALQKLNLVEKKPEPEASDTRSVLKSSTLSSTDSPAVNAVNPPAANEGDLNQFQKFWVNSGGKEIQILFLFADKVFKASYGQRQAPVVASKIASGSIPYDFLLDKTSIPLKNLIKVEGKVNSIRIDFQGKSKHKETVTFNCKDEKMMVEILDSLEVNMGTGFERSIAPMNRGSILLGNGIILSIILGLSTFFYFAAADFQTNNQTPVGSARTRGLIILLEFLGPNGVACIGGGIFLLFLFVMVLTLVKPPLVTQLTRKAPNNTPPSLKK